MVFRLNASLCVTCASDTKRAGCSREPSCGCWELNQVLWKSSHLSSPWRLLFLEQCSNKPGCVQGFISQFPFLTQMWHSWVLLWLSWGIPTLLSQLTVHIISSQHYVRTPSPYLRRFAEPALYRAAVLWYIWVESWFLFNTEPHVGQAILDLSGSWGGPWALSLFKIHFFVNFLQNVYQILKIV